MNRLFIFWTFILVSLLVACNEESAAPEEIPGETIVDTVYVDKVDTLIDTLVVDNTDTLIVDRYRDIVEHDTLFTDPECTTSEIDGLVTVTCGSKHTLVYKGSCDSISYDPTKNFCYQGNILDFCGGFSYDPSRYFCYNDSLVRLCNGSSFDLSTLFCLSDSLIIHCNGNGYDVTRQFCFNDSIYDFCEGKRYNPDSTSCNFTKVDTLVMHDTLFTDPDCITTEVDGLVTVTCGSKSTQVYRGSCDSISYDPAKSFCYEGKIFDLCGGFSYNPTKSFCHEDSLVDLCKDASYDPSNHFCDERDGQVYRMVTIGEQTWMAENLNFAYNEKTSTSDSSSFCYDNKSNFCAKYGRLYLWSAAMDSSAVFSDDDKGCGARLENCATGGNVRGVCPEGWHLPDTTEWKSLFTAVGGMGTAGTLLESTSGWFEDDDNVEDSFGFSVLPSGYRSRNGDFIGVYSQAFFWSSTRINGSQAYFWFFCRNKASMAVNFNSMSNAYSVRCVRNSN